jgi:excisionase family DNA binding protein
MSTKTNTSEEKRLALPASEVAKLLGISERHLWAMNASGRVPRPIRFGRAVRWNRADLEAWLDADAPERSVWEAMRKEI